MTLEARDLACERGGRLVFENLSFQVEPGGALLLRGPNGSGKSSLLRLIAGLLRRQAGSLTWQGREVAEEPDDFAKVLHYIGHLDGVKSAFTVAENLAFWCRLFGEAEGLAAGLACFDLAALAEVPAQFLSAGQRRRLGLARLPAIPRTLWLLDEPSVSLDSASVAELAALIAEHRAGGGMVIAATHVDLGLAAADTLHMGRTIAESAA